MQSFNDSNERLFEFENQTNGKLMSPMSAVFDSHVTSRTLITLRYKRKGGPRVQTNRRSDISNRAWGQSNYDLGLK
jgi:hypothetical protein